MLFDSMRPCFLRPSTGSFKRECSCSKTFMSSVVPPETLFSAELRPRTVCFLVFEQFVSRAAGEESEDLPLTLSFCNCNRWQEVQVPVASKWNYTDNSRTMSLV